MTTPDRIITAQRLRDGVVVFWSNDGTWAETADTAQLLSESDADEILAWARQPSQQLEIVDAYPIVMRDGSRTPIKTRESIRLVGPSVRPDLQKARA
ncbi:MAG: DUF2849 domain-containing protein [Myxococcota bacterium]